MASAVRLVAGRTQNRNYRFRFLRAPEISREGHAVSDIENATTATSALVKMVEMAIGRGLSGKAADDFARIALDTFLRFPDLTGRVLKNTGKGNDRA